MRDRVMNMARRIIEQPRPAFSITISGGEPTLHPFLADITHYLLSSRRSVELTVETNGSQEIAYYLGLIKGLPKGKFRLSIGAHPEYANLEKILGLCAAIGEHGQKAHLRIVKKSDEATWSLAQMAPRLSVIPFLTHEIVEPDDRAVFSLCTGASAAKDSSAGHGAIYCCHGVNLLLIEPDGHYSGATCALGMSPLPLWEGDASLDDARIVTCAHNNCQGYLNPLLPKFSTRLDAETMLAKFAVEKLRWKYEAKPLAGQLEPSVEDLALARLRRLTTGSAPIPGILPQPVWESWPEAFRVYEALQDESSRHVFLACLKSFEEGNPQYLASFNERGLHEIQPEWLKKLPFSLRSKEPLSMASLKKMATLIRANLPYLELALPWDCQGFLEQLQWLLGEFPDYSFWLTVANGAPLLRGRHPAQCPPHPLARLAVADLAWGGPQVSFVLVCGNDQDRIADTLDSILMQGTADMEAIVIDNGSTDATQDILARISAWAGETLKVIRLDTAIAESAAWKEGFDLARGHALVFASPGDVFAVDFLEKGLEALANADIAVLGSAYIEQDLEWHTFLDKIGTTGEESLLGWLEAWANGLGIAACLFDMAFLLRNNIQPGRLPDYFELPFGSRSFLLSRRTVAVPAVKILQTCRRRSGFGAWVDAIAWLHNLFKDCDLHSPEIMARCAAFLYGNARDSAKAEIRAASRNNGAAPLLNEINLQTISSSPQTLALMLKDYALAYCRKRNLNPAIRNEDLDWRRNKLAMRPQKTYEAYTDAERPAMPAPKISVIVPNYNKVNYLDACIRSIITQSMRDFELIVIDDHSTDGCWEKLLDYADLDDRIRLFRMDHNCRQGICRNIGIDKARGEYIVFVDSDDIMAPGFLEYGYNEIRNHEADLALFSCRTVREDGEIEREEILEDGYLTAKEAWDRYKMGKLWTSVWGRFYKADWLKTAGVRFPEYVFHQDHPFFSAAIKNARKLITRSFVATTVILSKDSAIRPASYSYIRCNSSFWLLRYYDSLVDEPYEQTNWRKHAQWLLEHLVLPGLFSYFARGCELPLDEEVYELMAGNKLLAYVVLHELAEQQGSAAVGGQSGSACLVTPWRRKANAADTAEAFCCTGLYGGEFLLFHDKCNPLSETEIRHALALLQRNQDLDVVCYPRTIKGQQWQLCEPGEYSGEEVFVRHCHPDAAPLLLGSCVFRSRILTENDGVPSQPLADHVLIARALLNATRVRICLPVIVREARRGQQASWRDALWLACSLWALAEQNAGVKSKEIESLLAKLLALTNFEDAELSDTEEEMLLAEIRRCRPLHNALRAQAPNFIVRLFEVA